MTKLAHLILLLSLGILFCTSKNVPKENIELRIYPSSGGDVGYVLTVTGNMITTSFNKMGVLDGEVAMTDSIIKKSSIKLSEMETAAITKYVSQIGQYNNENYEIFLHLIPGSILFL